MRAHGRTKEAVAGALAAVVIAGSWLAVPRAAVAAETKEPAKAGATGAAEQPAQRPKPARPHRLAAARPARIQVTFKLDPRLTRSLYMGDRWVSPPTYTSTHPQGKKISIEARAKVVDARGRPVPVEPSWTPSDPDVLAVSARGHDAFEIQVRRAGRASLRLEYGPLVKALVVETVEHDGFWRVDISQ